MQLRKYLGLGFLVLVVLVGVTWFIQQGRGEPSAPPAVTASAPSAVITLSTTATVTPEVASPTGVVPGPVGVDDVPMVEVPAGEFLMGSTAADVARWNGALFVSTAYYDHVLDEWPQMVVYLDTFEMDQVEVTYARYMRCVAANVCAAPQEWDHETSYQGPDHPDYPVRVERSAAATYCQWVDKRLPTEMEWEKAARGTDGRIYPWGNEWDENRLSVGSAITNPEPLPVGSYPQGASPYGALDMLGNVGEWIAGTYSVYPGGLYTETNMWGDGKGAALYRGQFSGRGAGMHISPQLHYRAANRFWAGGVSSLGFRCVRGPEPPPLSAALVSAEHVVQPPPLTQVDLSGMVEIPAGEFLMGSSEDGPGSSAYPEHTVYLDRFYIDRYEITYGEYVEFLNALGSNDLACNGITCIGIWTISRDEAGHFAIDSRYANYPAARMSWAGADAYCRWRGKRLPTEAEWEKAARGTDGRRYPWGEEWNASFYARTLSPVGSYPQDVSPYGVWDMYGNVEEFTADLFDPVYYTYSPARNPQGPEKSEFIYRTVRGAGVGLFHRKRTYPARQFEYYGTRCAYTP